MQVHTPFRYGIDTLDASTALALAQGIRKGVIDDQAKAKIVKSYSDVAEKPYRYPTMCCAYCP